MTLITATSERVPASETVLSIVFVADECWSKWVRKNKQRGDDDDSTGHFMYAGGGVGRVRGGC